MYASLYMRRSMMLLVPSLQQKPHIDLVLHMGGSPKAGMRLLYVHSSPHASIHFSTHRQLWLYLPRTRRSRSHHPPASGPNVGLQPLLLPRSLALRAKIGFRRGSAAPPEPPPFPLPPFPPPRAQRLIVKEMALPVAAPPGVAAPPLRHSNPQQGAGFVRAAVQQEEAQENTQGLRWEGARGRSAVAAVGVES